MVSDHSDHQNKVDGGVQAVTKYLVEALVEIDDIDLHVISFRYGLDRARQVEAEGYTRHHLPGARFGAITGYWKDQRSLSKCLEAIRTDVVQGQGISHDGIVATRSRYPSVLTIHGILQEEALHYSRASRRARHRLQNLLSKHYCIRGAKHTILISPYMENYWGDRLAGERYLIPNPIAPEFFEIIRQAEDGRILFAGRLYQLKGVIDLIHAASKLGEEIPVRVILAGSLDDRSYVEMLRNEVNRLGMQEKVEFRGILDGAELKSELARAAVLVLPSYQESAPMVVQEAMASGVPVVASNVGGIPFQIKDGQSGFLVDPGDVHMLTKRLAQLLADASMCDSFGKEARIHAIDKFRAMSVAKATVDVYRSIIS
jgi:glycosyltransferase involved in cell wall biosynthesis